jgi:hypothetical protein
LSAGAVCGAGFCAVEGSDEFGGEDGAGEACGAEACAAEVCEGIAQLSERAPPSSPHTTPTAITHHNLRLNRTTLCLPHRAASETLLKPFYRLKFAPIIEMSSSAKLRTNSC